MDGIKAEERLLAPCVAARAGHRHAKAFTT